MAWWQVGHKDQRRQMKQLSRKQTRQEIWGWLDMEDESVKEDIEETWFHFLGQLTQETPAYEGKVEHSKRLVRTILV